MCLLQQHSIQASLQAASDGLRASGILGWWQAVRTAQGHQPRSGTTRRPPPCPTPPHSTPLTVPFTPPRSSHLEHPGRALDPGHRMHERRGRGRLIQRFIQLHGGGRGARGKASLRIAFASGPRAAGWVGSVAAPQRSRTRRPWDSVFIRASQAPDKPETLYPPGRADPAPQDCCLPARAAACASCMHLRQQAAALKPTPLLHSSLSVTSSSAGSMSSSDTSTGSCTLARSSRPPRAARAASQIPFSAASAACSSLWFCIVSRSSATEAGRKVPWTTCQAGSSGWSTSAAGGRGAQQQQRHQQAWQQHTKLAGVQCSPGSCSMACTGRCGASTMAIGGRRGMCHGGSRLPSPGLPGTVQCTVHRHRHRRHASTPRRRNAGPAEGR